GFDSTRTLRVALSNSSPKVPSAGVRLGDFELGDMLGRGGFSSVFAARDMRLDRNVAIKVLHLEVEAAEAERLLPHFAREINVARRLEHPNIVRLYDFGETDEGLLWMAMELVRGEELGSVVHRDCRLAPTRAISIVLQSLSGLAEA